MENQIKNLLLNYAAHLSINCEFINPKNHTCSKKGHVTLGKPSTPPIARYERRFENALYKQNHVANCLANVLLIVDKLMENNAKLLIINGHLSKLQLVAKLTSTPSLRSVRSDRTDRSDRSNRSVYPPRHMEISHQPQLHKTQTKSKHKLPSLLQGGWVNGACSNWSSLRKVAWNSHQLVQLTGTLDNHRAKLYHMESWFSEAFSFFRGLQSLTNLPSARFATGNTALLCNKQNDINKFKLAYKHKPDCVFVINGSRAVVRECKALNVPLCILSSSTKFKVAASYLESNQESCFLTYLITSAILNMEKA